ncbi:hypothetical protein ABFV80_001358 [Vandammella animalimorsus]|uniref:hypothetical protein n=1 Tax=Vandammella animalimorsus TaxID=2029117 RepID=UPI00325B065E
MVFITELLIFKQAPQKRDGRHVSHAADAEKAANRKITVSKQEIIDQKYRNSFPFYRSITHNPQGVMASVCTAAMVAAISPHRAKLANAADRGQSTGKPLTPGFVQICACPSLPTVFAQASPYGTQSYVLYKMRMPSR